MMNLIDGLRVSGKTWDEIADILNEKLGNDWNESAYRKPYTAYKEGQIDQIKDEDILQQLQRVEIEKKKLNIMRSANNELVRDMALSELYYEQLGSALKDLKTKPIAFKPKLKGVSYESLDYVVVLSDLHYDGNFDLERIFNDIQYRLIKALPPTYRLVLVEAGDLIEGASLRPSQMRAIKLGMIDQIMEVSERYAQFIEHLHRTLNIEIEFHTVTSSNHTQLRPLNTKRNELMDEDLMRVFAWYMKNRLEQHKGITVSSDEDLNIKVNDKTNLFVNHGDKYGLTPNNLQKTIKDIAFYHNSKANFYLFGHYHQYREELLDRFEGTDSKGFLVPALCPTKDSYERLGLMGANPGFALFAFTKDGTHAYTKTIGTIKFD